MTELLPCPYCGCAALSSFYKLTKRFDVFCCNENCEARVKGVSEIDAIKIWNTRHTPWQPIETAPRDGARILLSDGEYLLFGNFYTVSPCDCGCYKKWLKNKWVDEMGRALIPQPKYWQRPTPPEK